MIRLAPENPRTVASLEGRLTTKESTPMSELSPGEAAVRLINERLTDATDDVLDNMTLEQLLEHVARAGSLQQSMYYI